MTETADRQAGIDPVSRLESGDMSARFLHDTGAFIAEGQGHAVILDQPDGTGQVEHVHRVDRCGLDPNQELIVPHLRDGDILDGNADILLHCLICAAFKEYYPSFFLVKATPATRGPALAATAAPIW